jgi:hypothetical protein
MYFRKQNYLIVTLLIFYVTVNLFAGGGKRNGTAGAQELLIPVGANGLSLHGSNVSSLTGIEALYYNPAGLGSSKNPTEAIFSHMSYIADIGVSSAAVSAQFEGFGVLAFSVKSLDFGKIPVTTVANPQGTGSTFSPSFVTLGISYANSLTDRIHVGVTFNLITEKIVNTSATGIGFNAGVQYSGIAEVEGLKFGIVFRNIGPQMKFDGPDLLRTAGEDNGSRGLQNYKIDAASFELPSQLDLGLSYEKEFSNDFKGLVSSSFEHNNFLDDQIKVGAEFGYQNMFYLRGGWATSNGSNSTENQIFGPTFGAGVVIDAGIQITVNYAYRSVSYFSPNNMVDIKFGF